MCQLRGMNLVLVFLPSMSFQTFNDQNPFGKSVCSPVTITE